MMTYAARCVCLSISRKSEVEFLDTLASSPPLSTPPLSGDFLDD
jgi:hypothetical protein